MPIRVPVNGQLIPRTYLCPEYPDDPVKVNLKPLNVGQRNALRSIGFGPIPEIGDLKFKEGGLANIADLLGCSEDEAAEKSRIFLRDRREQERCELVMITDSERLASARAAFVAGVVLVDGMEFEGGPADPTPEQAAGMMWDHGEDWFRERIASDLVSLNSASRADLGN